MLCVAGIERRTESNVQLHKSEHAWKADKVAKDDESEEAKNKVNCRPNEYKMKQP